MRFLQWGLTRIYSGSLYTRFDIITGIPLFLYLLGSQTPRDVLSSFLLVVAYILIWYPLEALLEMKIKGTQSPYDPKNFD